MVSAPPKALACRTKNVPPCGVVPPSSVSRSFVRVTEKTPNVAGRELKAVSNPGGGPLFGDALEGVEEFAVALDNGTYRITVLSYSHNTGRYSAAPVGYRIAVNGER